MLEPLLFLVFINDRSNCSLNTSPRLYADDTFLITSNDNLNALEEKVNSELKIVYNWALQNKIAINLSKPQCLIISPKLKENSLQLHSMINIAPITVVKSKKYWGIHIDSKLNFEDHIKCIKTKVPDQ